MRRGGYAPCTVDYSGNKKVRNTEPLAWSGWVGRSYWDFTHFMAMDPKTARLELITVEEGKMDSISPIPDHNRVIVAVKPDGTIVSEPKTG